MFATASGDKFIKHVSTICTSHQLNLLPSMGVEELLDNVESFYQSIVKPNKWAKAVDSNQQSVFVVGSRPFGPCNCYNCGEKGGTRFLSTHAV